MEKKINLKIDTALEGKEIRSILRSNMELSASIIKELKKTENGIMLNGEKVFVDRCVKIGDELVISIADMGSKNIVPVNIPLDILYEDEEIIAVNKPGTMPTHPSQNHYYDTLANGIMYYFKDVDFTFRAITRLDRETSGVVIVAKNPLSAQILGNQMKKKEIQKEYIAVVNGVPEPQSGVIDAPIKRKGQSVMLRCVAIDGKEAITEYAVEEEGKGFSLVRLKPLTGRTHQLRVHMSYNGTPIYGDDLYGAPQKSERTRLHCRSVTFLHPVSKEKIKVEAPVPFDMEKLFELLY